MKLIDKDGKPLSTEGVDPKVVTLITAGFESLSGQVGGAISASLKPLETKIETSLGEIRTNIEAMPKAEPKKDESLTNENTSSDPAVKAILDKLEAMEKKQNDLEQSTAAEREAKAAGSLTQSFIEKNFPNLKGKDIIIARISAAKPKDEEAVKAELGKIRAEQEAIYGKEVVEKTFSADPSAEGATKKEPDTEEAEAQAKVEKINAQLKP